MDVPWLFPQIGSNAAVVTMSHGFQAEWKCRCGTICSRSCDKHACDDCGLDGCTWKCTKPNLKKASGSKTVHYSCQWCRKDKETEKSEPEEKITIVEVEKLFRCMSCDQMQKEHGSLFCEMRGCWVASCGCDKNRWFICEFQRMLHNYRLRGACPSCLEHLKTNASPDTCNDGRDDELHLQYLRYFVNERDAFRNPLVQEYLRSWCTSDFI
jgi:hypothetical protein